MTNWVPVCDRSCNFTKTSPRLAYRFKLYFESWYIWLSCICKIILDRKMFLSCAPPLDATSPGWIEIKKVSLVLYSSPGSSAWNYVLVLNFDVSCKYIPTDRWNSWTIVFQLTEGEMYELVVTNHRGLYRYRTSDVIKIVGHYNQIPLYRFCYR